MYKVFHTTIEVPILPGKKKKLEKKLLTLPKTQQHRFQDNTSRYIMIDENIFTMAINWQVLPDFHQWRQDLESFQEAFADVLDWSKVKTETKRVMLWEKREGGREPREPREWEVE